MITIIARFGVLPGKDGEFIKHAVDVTRETRKERGNLSYKILRSEEPDGGFTFIEEWLNDAAIEQHNSAKHFVKFMDAIKPIIKGDVSIERLSKVPSIFY
ncbi:MAG TPA: antibiotic biosynthesis monooxygenase, partial [Candidatus Ornithomonoglobus intestinigallinarum]|nr:antibiotic biosynthesis monooxygenase [Candidatus Ornithomonoglobus intestinigallinarum]